MTMDSATATITNDGTANAQYLNENDTEISCSKTHHSEYIALIYRPRRQYIIRCLFGC